MSVKRILFRWEDGQRPWRLYWSPSGMPAHRRRFKTLEEAAVVANALLDPKIVEFKPASYRPYTADPE